MSNDNYKQIEMDKTFIEEVIISTTERRGNGIEGDPIRIITKVYSKDGELIAQYDPCQKAILNDDAGEQVETKRKVTIHCVKDVIDSVEVDGKMFLPVEQFKNDDKAGEEKNKTWGNVFQNISGNILLQYTQEQMDKAREDAFNAGRIGVWVENNVVEFLFFKDYLKSINQ